MNSHVIAISKLWIIWAQFGTDSTLLNFLGLNTPYNPVRKHEHSKVTIYLIRNIPLYAYRPEYSINIYKLEPVRIQETWPRNNVHYRGESLYSSEPFSVVACWVFLHWCLETWKRSNDGFDEGSDYHRFEFGTLKINQDHFYQYN